MVEKGRAALGAVEAQLTQRYAHDYRIMCLGDPDAALRKLMELAGAGEDVALVLAGMPRPADTRSSLLGKVRALHPHAKRALLVLLNIWADKPGAEAVRALIASGYADFYVVRTADSGDEVFHEAISGFLLEWATERRIVPHTVRVVGEALPGRGLRNREVFGRCAVPHAFCLTDSEEGRGVPRQGWGRSASWVLRGRLVRRPRLRRDSIVGLRAGPGRLADEEPDQAGVKGDGGGYTEQPPADG